MLHRLSDDWQSSYAHSIPVAETFVNLAIFDGTLYEAANWQYLGDTGGFAQHSGKYTDPHSESKRLYVYPFPPEWELRGHVEKAPGALPSLYEELNEIGDFRRAQGRKHGIATVLAVYVLARLANMCGPVPAAEYASKLTQRELEAPGAWKNPKTGLHVPVSKSTLHRVIASVDPEQIRAAMLLDAGTAARPGDLNRRKTHSRRQSQQVRPP